MSDMRYLYGPSQRNVLPVSFFSVRRQCRPRRRCGSGPPPPPYPPPACGGTERAGGVSHLTSGSTSDWWNGGGGGRGHLRGGGPRPPGLLAAPSFWVNGRALPVRKITHPVPGRY